MTSLSRELGAEQDLGAFAATVTARFAEVFGREPVETDPAELGVAPAGGDPAPATLGDPR